MYIALIAKKLERWYAFHLLLIEINLLVPFTPYLGRSKHAAGTTLITKSCLTSAMCTRTRDTRDTGNGTSCKLESLAYFLSG